MTSRQRHRLIEGIAMAVVFSAPVAASLAIWTQLGPDERENVLGIVSAHPSSVISAFFFLLASLVAFVHWVFRRYVYPLGTIIEQSVLVTTVNPSHRITQTGNPDLDRITGLINSSSDRILELHNGLDERAREAQKELEYEKETLSALIHQLADGVIVCNLLGQIILYNRRAADMLSSAGHDGAEEGGRGGLIGLGRSVFGCIDRNVVAHATEELAQKLVRGEAFPVSHFVIAGLTQQLLRVRAVPVRAGSNAMEGFILVLSDITQQMEHDSRRNVLFQTLMEKAMTSLTTIRSAAESLHEYPEMAIEQRARFVSIINDESHSLSEHLEQTAATHARAVSGHWHLERALCEDLLSTFERAAGQTLDIQLRSEPAPEHLCVNVDSYSIIQALLFMTNELKRMTGSITFAARAGTHDGFGFIDILWRGSPLPLGTMRDWETHKLIIEGRGLPSTLRDVLQRHGAELWSKEEGDGRTSYLRLLFPAFGKDRPTRVKSPLAARSRPEFYDFDLFQRQEEPGDLQDRPLADLTYTAFDTETTGLHPSAGDEIISIGAVRILNGRILYGEVFDRLVDPGRELPPEAIRITGIRPEMIAGQPAIGKILPAFQTFAEGTVLVAHNGAFDMRFFQIKQESTGVRLMNPLLDTLLLSAVVHPEQEGHDIEAMAQRLGVNIIGRHTALGDALVTGELLLKLIPLLQNQGITTLRQAQEASRKTYYARIRY